MRSPPSRAIGASLLALLCLAGCHSNDYLVVKLEAASGLPPIAQLTLFASDTASTSTATEPATPVASGLAFPKTYVVSVPHSGAVSILATGLDVNGNVLARGAGSGVASGNVQLVSVTLSAACSNPLECDPAGVCSGAITCGDAGACVPASGNVVPDGTGCGTDGGVCQHGGCAIPQRCATALDCDPQSVCAGAVFCSDAGACLPGGGVVAPDGTGCGEDGGVCHGGSCVLLVCGSGIAVPGEQCDYGPDGGPFGLGNSNQGVCTTACQFAACGDGYVNLEPLSDGGYFQELCDWGSGADGGACTGPDGGCNSDTLSNHCRTNCLPARCGDGVLDQGERCDLGPPSPSGGNGTGNGCNATCTLLEVVSTIAGTGTAGHVDGPGNQAELYFPRGVALSSGVAYVADEFNDVIRSLDLTSNVVGTLAGSGQKKTLDGTGDAGAFYSPVGIVTFQGGLVVTEPTDVRQVTFSGTISTLTGTGNGMTGFADGPFSSATFGLVLGIQGVTTDGQNLFVADPPSVRFLDFTTSTVSTLGQGLALDAGTIQLKAPSGIVYLGKLIYTADQKNSVLDSVDPSTGVVTFLAGSPGGGGCVDGQGSQAVFNVPTGLCTDGQSLYVADTDNEAVRQVDPLTGVVTTVAGDNGLTAVDGVGRKAGFGGPAGCAFDPVSGDLIVTDQTANEVRRIH